MISQRKLWILGVVVLAFALGSIGWSWARLDETRSAALAGTREADACESLARDIASLRSPGVKTASEPARQTELNRRIAQAATEAGLPPRSIERIEHDPPRLAATGGSIEKPTRITIAQGTLPQLAKLFASLDRPREGVRLARIHLAAPNDAADSSAWASEAILIDTLPSNASIGASTRTR